jgi:hypothetical protein
VLRYYHWVNFIVGTLVVAITLSSTEPASLPSSTLASLKDRSIPATRTLDSPSSTKRSCTCATLPLFSSAWIALETVATPACSLRSDSSRQDEPARPEPRRTLLVTGSNNLAAMRGGESRIQQRHESTSKTSARPYPQSHHPTSNLRFVTRVTILWTDRRNPVNRDEAQDVQQINQTLQHGIGHVS